MPNEIKRIKSKPTKLTGSNSARQQVPLNREQDSKPSKKAGDGAMTFMVWSIAGTVIAACSEPIFGGGTDLTGGGGGGDTQSGPGVGALTNGRISGADISVVAVDENGARSENPVGDSDAAGNIILDDDVTLVLDAEYIADLDVPGAREISTGEGVSGTLRSLPYSGGDLVISPLTDLLAKALDDATDEQIANAGGDDGFYQGVLDGIYGESIVTVDDVLNRYHYNPLVTDDAVTQLVSQGATALSEIQEQDSTTPNADRIMTLQELFSGYRDNIADDDATNDALVLSDSGTIDEGVEGRIATAVARGGLPVVATPNGGDAIRMTEDQDLTLVSGNAEFLFGFQDPFGNSDSPDDEDDAIEPGQLVGIYIQAASVDGNVDVMFRNDDDTIVGLALVQGADRGVVASAPAMDDTPAVRGTPTPHDSTFFYVSAEHFARLILRPDANFNTANVANPQIRFYVYDGEDVTPEAGIGMLGITVAQQVPEIPAFTGNIADNDPASDTNIPAPVSGTFSTTSGTADTWMAVPRAGTTAYGTIVVTGDDWTFTLNAAGITEINRLDAGDTTDVIFDVTATNAGGDDTSTLTISLTGIDDASDGQPQTAPVIPAFTGSIADADPASDTNTPDPVSGTFATSSGTADTWTAEPQQGATAYGTIVVTGTQWTFTLNAAGITEINRLDAGDTPVQAVFDVTATNAGGSDTSTLTISLTGINDASDAQPQTAPVIPAFMGSIADADPASDTNTPDPVSGTFATTSGTADTWAAVPQAGATAYGTIVVTGSQWTFTLNAAGIAEINRLDAGDTPVQAVFDVTATNAGGADESTLTISLTGIDDNSDGQPQTAPVIPAFTGSIADADPASDTNAPDPVSGTFSATSGTADTWAAVPQAGATEYGTIVVTGSQWTFTLNAAGITEINRLDAGDTPVQAVFDVTATNAGGSDESTLTISLTGINDASDAQPQTAPVIGAFTGSIADADPASDTNAPDPVSGTFSATSGTVDTWTAEPPAGATEYGTISVTGAQWTFTLNAAGIAEINRLDAGDTPVQAVFNVTATNAGGDDTSTLTISLTGIEDNSDTPAPVIGAFTSSIVDADPASDTNAPDPVSGTFSTTSGTADTWMAVPRAGATAYGTIVVTGAQWTFTLNAAGVTEINTLDAGDTTDVIFDVTATNVGGDDTSTLTISLTGIDDNSDGPAQTAPVIPAFTGSITDADPASDTNAPDPVSGTFSTTSSTADTWTAVPQQGATEYGTIVVTGAQWTFTLNAAGITEINRLDAGGTTDAVFDVTATNAQGSAESTLTISLTGIVDNSDTPAPVIAAFTGSIADADPASDTNAPDPVSGTFATTSGTADTWTAVLRAGATEYGTIVVTGAQWTFTLNAAGITEINTLDAGDTTDVIFDVTAENVGGDDTSTLTISLTGIEDNSDTPAPVIGAFTGSIADADPASDTNTPDPVSGTFATTSGTADTWTAVPRAGATAYGTISVTGAQWTFTLNAAGVTEINTLDAGDTTDVIFDVTAENVGGDDTSTLTISLTGIDDNSDTPAPVIGAFTGSIADADPASDTNAPDPVSGTFSTTSGTADTWTAVPRAGATAYGTISVTGSQWTFTLNAAGIAEINTLDAGDTPAQAVFDVTAENVGGDDTSTLTISLTGIEDNSDTPAPVIAAFTGSITDDDPASDTNTPDPVSGTFSTTSGTADTWTAVPRAGATAYGTISVTGAQWTFTLNAAGVTEINTLDAGDTTDVIFDVTAENVGGDDTSTLTISLTGIDDNSDGPAQTAPVIPAFTGSITDADPASDTNAPDPVSGTFSTTSSTADTWTAVPQQGTTAYGTIVVTGAQWTFTLNAAGITEINRLDAGGTTDAVFDVTATNAQGSAESTLTISLTGIVDNSDTPAPVIAAFTGSIADADPASDTNAPDPVSGTFATTSGTADTWTAVPRAGATAYGTIVVTGAQWTFTLNTAGVTEINTLDAGDTTDVIFDVTAENLGGDDTSTLTISLTGIEDNSDTPAPVIGAFTGSIADADPASDTNTPDPVSGTFSTTSGTADTWTAVPRAGATAYGTISVTGSQWTFTLNAAGVTEINTLDAGDTTDVIFDVTAENVGGDDTSTLTISLTGIEDNSDTPAPVIGAFTGSIADADPASDTNAPAPVSGTFSTTSGTADTWTAVPQASTTAYGTISVTGSQWTFTLNAAGITEINSLDAGDTPAQAVFDVTATNVGGSDESTLTISLTGIEDNSDTPAPVIAAFTGSIADADPASDTNAPNPVSGTFATTSGTADTWTAVPQAGTTAYGTILVTGTQWTFTLNAAGITEINSLDAGDTPAQAVFDVTATNVGGSDESTLTISLTGIEDNSDTPAPVIGAFTGSIADADPASDTNAPTPVSGTFATTSGTADGWAAVPRAGATAYGTIVVTGTQWTFTLNAAGITEINRLDAGDTTDVIFDVTATNVGGSDASTLTISLTGIEDNSDTPAPVIGAFTGSIADADAASDTNAPAPVSGTFATTSGTADGWAAVPRAGATEYGTISVTGTQWTFTLNAAGVTEINTLDAGDTTDVIFDVTATNVGGSDASTLTISLTGIDDNSDAPLVVTNEAVRAFVVINGVEFRVNDDRNGSPHDDYEIFFNGAGADSVTTSSGQSSISVNAGGGDFSQTNIASIFNAATLSNLDIAAIILVEDNTVSAETDWDSDEGDDRYDFSSASTTLDRAVTEDDAADETARGLLQVTGATDADDYTYTGDFEGMYGDLIIDGDGNWTYIIDNTDPLTQGLNGGMSGTDEFAVLVTQTAGTGSGRSITETISITVNGANEPTPAPVFSGASEPTGTVTDTDTAFDNIPADLTGRSILLATVTGDITWSVATPVVAGDTTETDAAYFGELTFPGSAFAFGTPFDRSGSGLPWQFDPTVRINDLDAGESVTITYEVTATQGDSPSSTQDLVITLEGIDDALVFDTNNNFGPVVVLDPSNNAGDAPTATGTFSATDPDDDITWSATTTSTLGSVGFSSTTNGMWTFTLNTAGITALNDLASGMTQDITFDITANTVDAGSDLTIRLTGAAMEVTGLFAVPPATADTTGTAAADSLTGTPAAETIQGGNDGDTIITGGGNDLVIGGYGGDTITLDSDAVTAPASAETIVYRFESDARSSDGFWQATDGDDTINNFRRGQDKLIFIDVSDNTPITSLEEFIMDDDLPVIRFTGFNDVGGITSFAFTFPLNGTADGTAEGTPAGFELTVNFDQAAPLPSLASSLGAAFNDASQVVDFSVLNVLFGGSDTFDAFDVVDTSMLPTELTIL